MRDAAAAPTSRSAAERRPRSRPRNGTRRPIPPADLTNCEDEPIHVPGAIQPHGLLLAVDPRDARGRDRLRQRRPAARGPRRRGRRAARWRASWATTLAEHVRRRVAEGTLNEPLIVHLPTTSPGSLAGAEVDVALHLTDAPAGRRDRAPRPPALGDAHLPVRARRHGPARGRDQRRWASPTGSPARSRSSPTSTG